MRACIQAQVDGQMIAPHQPARRIEQECIGHPGLIEIDRRKEMPGAGAMRAGDDRLVVTPSVVKPKLADTPDGFGLEILVAFSWW